MKLQNFKERSESLHSKIMTDYVSHLLETDTAKRRLARLFESETLGASESTAIAARERNPSSPENRTKEGDTFPERRRTHRPVGDRTRTTTPMIGSGQIKKELTVSSFVFSLVLAGAILAAHTDKPIFWLLIGPAPVAILHTTMTLLRQVLRRRAGLLEFCERNR